MLVNRVRPLADLNPLTCMSMYTDILKQLTLQNAISNTGIERALGAMM